MHVVLSDDRRLLEFDWWTAYHSHAVGKHMISITRIAVPSPSNDLCNYRILRDGAHHPDAGVAHSVSLPSWIQVTALGGDNCHVLVELQLEVSCSRTGDQNMFLRAMLFLPVLYVDFEHPASLERVTNRLHPFYGPRNFWHHRFETWR